MKYTHFASTILFKFGQSYLITRDFKQCLHNNKEDCVKIPFINWKFHYLILNIQKFCFNLKISWLFNLIQLSLRKRFLEDINFIKKMFLWIKRLTEKCILTRDSLMFYNHYVVIKSSYVKIETRGSNVIQMEQKNEQQ